MNTVTQIGVTPRELLQQIAMNRALIGIISLAQAYWFRQGWIANKLFFRNKVQHEQ